MRHSNNKNFLKAFGLAILCCIASFSANATTYGFVSGTTCISSDGTSYSYQIVLPGTFSLFRNKSYAVAGGIEIAGFSTDSSTISIRSKTGADRSSYFTKYAKGRIYFSCEIPDDTACTNHCKYCNPSYSYSYDVYKIFDLNSTLNPIVGPVCVLTGDTVTYSVTPWVSTNVSVVGMDRYKWILPSTLTNNILYYSADSSSITFVINQLTGTDTIKAEIGQCNIGDASKITTLALNQAAPKPVIASVSCVKGGIQTKTFYLTNSSTGLTYTWSCDAQWKVSGASTGDSVVIQTDRASNCNIYVAAAYSGGGCSPSRDTLIVNRSFSDSISSISSSTSCVVANGTNSYSYSINNAPTSTVFHWFVPSGWTISGDATGSTITAIPSTSAVSGQIKVTIDACTNSDTLKYAVYVKPGTPDAIIGSTCVSRSTQYGYKVDTTTVTPTTSTYTWTVPTGWTIVNGQGTDTITVTTSATTDGTITVTPTRGTSGCNGTAKSLTVNFNPVTPTSITQSKTCINAGMPDTVTFTTSTSGVSGQTYEWSIPSNFGVIHSAASDNSSIVVYTKGLAGTYQIEVRATSTNCGNSDWFTKIDTITKEDFSVSESVIVPAVNSVYYTYPSASWVANHSFQWIYNGTNITNTSYPYSTTTTVAGLLSRTDSVFYVTVKNLTTGCLTRKTSGVGGFKSGTIANETLNLGESNNVLTLAPNPAQSKLRVSLSTTGSINIWITDISGNLVKNWMDQNSTTTVDVSDLVAGNYIVIVYQGNNRYSKQFIKK